jgi:hypothetical protein
MCMATFFTLETVYYNSIIVPLFGILTNLQINFMTLTTTRRAHYEFLHGQIFTLIYVFNVIVILLLINFRIYSLKRYYGR